MKYQIYLNQEASEIVNAMAQKDNKKPATFIKQMLESLLRIAKASSIQLEKELQNNGTREHKSE